MNDGDDSRSRRQPTIVEVADRAGVAIGTVSRYLNGQPVRAIGDHPAAPIRAAAPHPIARRFGPRPARGTSQIWPEQQDDANH